MMFRSWIVVGVLLLTLFTVSCADAAIADFQAGGSKMELFRSFAEFQRCSSDGLAGCFQVVMDPPVPPDALKGLIYVETARFGDIIEISYFNGYGPANPINPRPALPTELSNIGLDPDDDFTVVEVPVRSESPAPDPFDGKIVAIEFEDPASPMFENPAPNPAIIVFDAVDAFADGNPITTIERANVVALSAVLETSQVVPMAPDVGSPAPLGSAVVTYNLDTRRVDVTGSYRNLTTHPDGIVSGIGLFGPAEVGVVGDEILFTDDDTVLNGLAVTDDFKFSDLFDMSELMLTQAQGEFLLAGQTYLQISTAANPNDGALNPGSNGEIRGQIVPEPSSLALGLISLLGVGLRRCRRRD